MRKLIHKLFGCGAFWVYHPVQKCRSCKCCDRIQIINENNWPIKWIDL